MNIISNEKPIMQLTDEQENIASCTAGNIVINAFAGTGKTTTLAEYARRRPRERLMYVAFNKAVKEEAAKKFPRNVKCVTTHGLAFPNFGRIYQSKLGNPRAFHLSNALNGMDMISAGRVLEVITSYLISTDREIGENHALNVAAQFNIKAVGHLVDYARKAWEMMQDASNSAVPMPHDGYLKLYQLSNPVINTGTILFDECQDANPITLDFISKQKVNKVFVGDKYQSIYGFRGAVDALDSIKADQNLLLSSSFRFGSGIALLASELLADWQGCGNSIRGLGKHDTVFVVDRNRPHAVISRTNGGLFAEAVGLVSSNKPFGFVGGVENYRFDQILDAYNLMCGARSKIRDLFIASFENFDQMKLYGMTLGDREVKMLVKVVEEYTHDIPRLIEEIKKRALPKLQGREVALSTTHRAKGMEWMDVFLTDDFSDLEIHQDETGKDVPPDPEEINILYVAMTRAMRGLQVPSGVHNWVYRTGRGRIFDEYHKPDPQAAPPEAAPPESAVDNPVQEEPGIDLPQWKAEMDQYLSQVRSSVAASPEDTAAIARFLEEQARKFTKF